MSQITDNILQALPSPCWLLEEKLLRNNLQILKNIKDKTGANILLALKGYALHKSFYLVKEYLDGCCASGLNEALLAKEEFGKEVHTYSPAFKQKEIEQISSISNHLVFNSPNQLFKFKDIAKKNNPNISLGLRVNIETSVAPVELYNPCGIYSRLGTTKANFDENALNFIEGLHFHALCEESAESLKTVLEAFEKNLATIYKT
jgi:carboxynorspermidine decarboxylase